MLGNIDCRLRQAKGKPHDLFGGLSVILVGHLAQLPPVLATPIYGSSTKLYATAGLIAYRYIELWYILFIYKRL